MSKPHGAFVWHELMTGDLPAAKSFYEQAMGWTCKHTPDSGPDYAIFSAGDVMVAGLMKIPDEAKARGAPPMWSGYIYVDDVDAATAKVKTLGGTICHAPTDIPNIGRFSVVTDPQGATFELFKPMGPMPENPPPPDLPGRVGWNELYAKDMEKVFPFYADLFGWTKGEAIDMGPMGTYQLFHHGDQAIGGMMTKPPHVPVAAWGFYFNTTDLDATMARTTAADGKIVHGPVHVPGGSWIAQAIDPQGAAFAMVGPRA